MTAEQEAAWARKVLSTAEACARHVRGPLLTPNLLEPKVADLVSAWVRVARVECDQAERRAMQARIDSRSKRR